MVTFERAQEILDENVAGERYDAAGLARGIAILLKHDPKMNTAAEHDIFYAADSTKVLETITEEELIELRKCGWNLDDENNGFCRFT